MSWIEKAVMGENLRDAFAPPADDPFADLLKKLDDVTADADEPVPE